MLTTVCGAGGFIGGWLVKRLLDDGSEVRAVDIKPKEKWWQVHPGAQNIDRCDLRMLGACSWVCTEADEVYQLAADMGGAGFVFSGDNDAAVMHNSAQINLNIAEQAREWKFRTFYSSSACVYPRHNQTDPNNPNCEESTAYPADPDSPYGFEKLFSERLYESYARNHGLYVRVARFHNIFGPLGSWKDGREKAPAAICRKVATAKLTGDHRIEIWGDGCQPAGERVFTDKGLVDISQIQIGDSVIGIGGFQRVTNVFSRAYTGLAYKIESEGTLPFVLTEEHPVLVNRLDTHCRSCVRHWCKPNCFCLKHHKSHPIETTLSWRAAGDLAATWQSRRDYLCIPRLLHREENTVIDLSPFVKPGHNDGRHQEQARINAIEINEDWAWILGLYMAEGYCSKGKIVSWCLGAVEDQLRQELHSRLKRCGISPWDDAPSMHNGMPSGQETHACSAPLSRWLPVAFNGRQNTRRVPAFMFNQPDNIVSAFLQGYMRGDGEKNSMYRSERRKGSSCSLDILVGIQILTAKLGNFGIIHWSRNWGNRGNCHGTISLASSPVNVHWFSDSQYIYVPIKRITAIPLDEPVYNIETENHSYGTPAILHNSQTRSFCWIDDCIRGIMDVMDGDNPEPVNLGSSEMVTINQLVDYVERIAGIRLERSYKLDAPRGVAGRNSDNTEFRRRYGWQPSTGLRDGLEKTYAWIEEQVRGDL